MESTRQKKVARLIQRELGTILTNNFKHEFEGAMITITDVSMSPDLAVAKVHVSLFLTKDPNKTLNLLKENVKAVRGLLGSMIGKQLRIVPDLIFIIDDSLAKALRIDELLRK